MLFNFPSFLNTKEQTQSDRLYNNLKILVQTSVDEIWYDVNFGTNIRDSIKAGISDIVISDIRDELIEKITTYFQNDLQISRMDIYQIVNKLRIELDYVELRTGLHKTLITEQDIENKDMSLYQDNLEAEE